VQVEQPGAGALDVCDEFLVGCLLALVDPLEVDDELHGVLLAGLAHHVSGSDTGQQLARLGDREVTLCSAGDELDQELVELADHPGVLL